MEHVIQLGINLDDDAIRRSVEKEAKDRIIESIKKDVEREMGIERRISGWGQLTYSADVVVKEVINAICDDCRDQIIELAASKLAERAPRQKWYREMMSGAVGEAMER